jgi:hypothetical protein
MDETTVIDKYACHLNNTASELCILYRVMSDEPIVDISCSFFHFLFLYYFYLCFHFLFLYYFYLCFLCSLVFSYFFFSPLFYFFSFPFKCSLLLSFFLSFNRLIISGISVSEVYHAVNRRTVFIWKSGPCIQAKGFYIFEENCRFHLQGKSILRFSFIYLPSLYILFVPYLFIRGSFGK